MYERTKMDDEFSEWHSIRPWNPTLSLSVREITSVSVTFILSSPFSDSASTDPPFASLGLPSSSDDNAQSLDNPSVQVVSDVLAKGLSVKVNGTPWQRVLMKMDEDVDEAVIILFGLMPGKQYDLELGILPGEASIRGQITTGTETHVEPSIANHMAEEALSNNPPIASTSSMSLSPLSDGTNLPSPSTSPPSAFTLEDRRAQLTQKLNTLNAEHASLTSSLKAARRDSQKADAALRTEIDNLKRASERQAAGEQRARQKVLALQEAVKQTVAAARDIETLVTNIELSLPGLEERKALVEIQWRNLKQEAEAGRARRKEIEQREDSRSEALRGDLSGMASRLEKLNAKREKLEGDGGVLSDLEEKLRRLEQERTRIERDPYGYEGDVAADQDDASEDRPRSRDERSGPEPDGRGSHHSHHHSQSHSHPRKRHSHPHGSHSHHPAPPNRASGGRLEPINRPLAGRASFPPPVQQVPGVIYLPNLPPTHQKTGSHARAVAPPFRAKAPSGSSSVSSLASTVPASGSTSNLSSRAPPFEPGRGLQYATSKSDLNPGSNPFSPRSAAAQAVAAMASGDTSGMTRVP